MRQQSAAWDNLGLSPGKYNVMSITSYLLWPSVGWKLFKWLLHLSCTCGQVKLKIATSNKAETARSAFWAVPAEDVRRISEPKSSKSHLPWTESVHYSMRNIQIGNKIDYCSFGPEAKPPNLSKWKAFNIEKQVSNSFHTFHIIAPGPPLPLLLLAAIAAPWVQREACVAKPRRVGLDLCKMWHWRGVSYVFMAITYNYSTSM